MSHSIADLLLNLEEGESINKGVEQGNKESFEGTYEMFPGKYFSIVSRNDSLFLQQYGFSFEIPLQHSQGNLYSIPMLPKYNIKFKQNQFDFHIVDSKFNCEKVEFNPPNLDELSLSKFCGLYYNKDFGIFYRIFIENGAPIANSKYNTNIALAPLDKTTFYSSYQFFGKVNFIENLNGEYDHFELSGSLLNGIIFEKL